MDTVHKQEFRIRDLGTRSVTLFPTRAHVVREIKDVTLKPGSNQITLVGMTPTVDEDSIKVEGTGSAIITDISVEQLPNREIFQEIYPEDDEDDSSGDESEVEKYKEVKESAELKAVREKLALLRDEQKAAHESIASAERRLHILDKYSETLNCEHKVDIQAAMSSYRAERDKLYGDQIEGEKRLRSLEKDFEKLVEEETELAELRTKEQAKVDKARAKMLRARQREQEKKRRRQLERQKEKLRIRKERLTFWPRVCYSVRITLEAANLSPMTSRRSSIASSSDLVKVVHEKEMPEEEMSSATCDLVISYVTTGAFWSPSYDLALTTTSSSAMLCFDASLTNLTSETWTNCRMVLSTSQTTFSGVNDSIPVLVPWRIKLAGKGSYASQNEALDSREERTHKQSWIAQQNVVAQKPRADLFGLNDEPLMELALAMPPPPPMLQQAPHQVPFPQQRGGLMMQQQAAPKPAGVFGAASAAPVPLAAVPPAMARKASPAAFSMLGFGGSAKKAKESADMRRSSSVSKPSFSDEEADDGATVLPQPEPELSFQESAVEETGLTTTYDLPGLKTLAPSSTASKQRVARISFNGVLLSHTIVAKYRPAAYLKAKLRNASKLTLLRGPVGLTLDGTFMGRATLPRCSAGDSFTMSLGVDPNIRVVYPKADVKRSTTGIFSKEDSSLYTRSVTVSNTRAAAGKPVTLMVLDQVPVSEDEKLRVDVVQPRGMAIGGSGVSAGLPGREGKDEADWGKATATLKKGGEVCWDVTLKAGRSVKLMLEYEVALPTGDHVTQC